MITLTVVFPGVTPEQIYSAWLSGAKHTAMTGGKATARAQVGSKFTAWDGYIWGKTIALVSNKKIVQAWRASEFSEDDPDSKLTITLTGTKVGTKLVLTHQGTPKKQEAAYRQGWRDHYFESMQAYFATKVGS